MQDQLFSAFAELVCSFFLTFAYEKEKDTMSVANLKHTRQLNT